MISELAGLGFGKKERPVSKIMSRRGFLNLNFFFDLENSTGV
jgi:hypothetical protein